ncbi:hypothetical protein PHILAsVB114_03345 [Candidatus Planktophila limnetica]|uniref:Uncharacterized protein n=1 Tax=Candidatus Planktophila limnetica TaxID=573600 RepID=A0A249LEZ1_9ACTN|nr:hypothetical protein [Candidatus Planktophila limnetica]ASY27690.1 hypothetical protein PHILAsVB114_03345 [Candidatus Planktophila limnetica]
MTAEFATGISPRADSMILKCSVTSFVSSISTTRASQLRELNGTFNREPIDILLNNSFGQRYE